MALLMPLPDRYRVFVSTQNNNLRTAAATGVSLSNTIGVLLEEETLMSLNRPQSSQNRALYAGRGARGGQGGQFANRQNWQTRPRTVGARTPPNPNHKRLTCNWCKLVGHIEANCRKKRMGKPRKTSPEANVTSRPKMSNANIILAVYLAHAKFDERTWFVDSGASAHICHDRKSLYKYQVRQPGQFVLLGNESGLSTAGVVSVRI